MLLATGLWGETTWLDEVQIKQTFCQGITVTPSMRSALTFPVRFQTEIVGLFALFKAEAEPADEQLLELLAILGYQAGASLIRMRSEARLRESERRYHIVADSVADAVISIDEHSTIAFANPAVERMFGYLRKELLGASLTMLMPQSLRAKHLDALARYLKTGQRHIPWSGVELVGLRKSGEEFAIEVTFGEVVTQNGRLFTGVIRDIQERKRYTAERERLLAEAKTAVAVRDEFLSCFTRVAYPADVASLAAATTRT